MLWHVHKYIRRKGLGRQEKGDTFWFEAAACCGDGMKCEGVYMFEQQASMA